MWEVTALRSLAISHLNKLDTIEMILLGDEYRVLQWFVGGCTKLIVRGQGPTAEEAALLGVGLTVQIYGIRERFITFRLNNKLNPYPAASFDCQRAVNEAFAEKIANFD
jgi:hypothetical protein